MTLAENFRPRRQSRFISSETIEAIAADVRAAAGPAGDGYAVDIEAIARGLGCDVRYVQFSPATVSARVQRRTGDGWQYVIEVNASDSRARQRFSIAHELAHVVLHGGDDEFGFVEYRMPLTDYVDQSLMYKEVQANMLAAALLMPQSLVADFWRTRPDIDDLASQFGVSKDSAYWRVNNLRLPTDG